MKIEEKIDVSVIITVSRGAIDCNMVFEKVNAALGGAGKRSEFIFIEHADSPQARARIQELGERFPNQVILVPLRSVFGESDALLAGFARAKGAFILILPEYSDIEYAETVKLIKPLEQELDMVAARRVNRKDSRLNRVESAVFNGLVRRLLGVSVHDLGCGVIAMRKEVADSLDLYGDLFRFIPVLAFRQGYKVGESDIHHVPRQKKSGLYAPGVYLRRILDIITLFFIVKFTKKPLRFFGLTGFAVFIFGTMINLYLTASKFAGNPVANRPLLILGTLFMVLGIQLVSIGLIGELIIFIHGRSVKEYRVDKTL